jgi:hypothetical protein
MIADLFNLGFHAATTDELVVAQRRTLVRLVGALFVIVASVFVVNVSTLVSGAAPLATCQAKNVAVTIGATSKNALGTSAGAQVTPVYFTNHSSSCRLLLGGPVAIALRGAFHGQLTPTSEESMPSAPDNEKQFVLKKGARDAADFEVVLLAKSVMASAKCGVQSASGFEIQNFAKPFATSRYFARPLAGVCFYRGPAQASVNIKMLWLGSE